MDSGVCQDEEFAEGVFRLLEQARLPDASSYRWQRLPGGRNNQVYRLSRPEAGEPLLLKHYFSHPADQRDRLGAEFSFLQYAWGLGLRCIAEPLASLPERRMGLYRFLPGRAFEISEVDVDAVSAAIAFFAALNRGRPHAMPLASEACFSIDQHVRLVEHRVARLERAAARAEADLASFVLHDLRPTFDRVVQGLVQQAERLGIDPRTEIGDHERCVSPSDFGFHNALIDGGSIFFCDFEYAGWDDSAKLVCDFFCQVALPVPERFFDGFADAAIHALKLAPTHRRRFDLLLPLYRIKWTSILLNEFTPEAAARRRFARDAIGTPDAEAEQLTKARAALERLGA